MARPSSFKPEYVEQVYRLCLLGATDAELGAFFSVTETTINRWKTDHPEFCESLKLGKNEADSRVAESLFRRATGYSHQAVKIFADVKTGEEMVIPYTENYPPDTTACIFWLKNRQKGNWRDKVEQGITDAEGKDVAPAETVVKVYLPDNGRN